MAMGVLDLAGGVAVIPSRRAVAMPADDPAAVPLPDIQFDIGAYTAPAQTIDGILVAMPPIHTVFLTARLLRTPGVADQQEMARALNTLEAAYPFSANALITFVSYGLPYFRRLPSSVVNAAIPKLRSNTARSVLEEAIPSPTDVSSQNPGISKLRFNVPVRIENNDVLFTLRSDNSAYLQDALNWLSGSNTLAGLSISSPRFAGLLTFTSSRAMFAQMGLPKFVASNAGLPFAPFLHPHSPMWMGFADQQTNAAGPAPICTFAGNSSSRLTTAVAGDYFDNGGIQHLSHVILDMEQFFDMEDGGPPGDDGVFTERVQYMFRSTPPPSQGNADQFTNGGGPSFLPNEFKGTNDARNSAQGIGTPENEHRIGHLSGLQRSSRAADGTPVHIRMDGPGFDGLDVPGGVTTAKLQFTAFVPTADFFATMRRNQASLDLAQQNNVPESDNGLERFMTTTRRQNFLVPPRRNRAFPLVERV
jgi:hypothetical protein